MNGAGTGGAGADGADMRPQEAFANSGEDFSFATEGLLVDAWSFTTGVLLLMAAGFGILQGLSVIATD
jgi:hypothetical protein